MSKLLQLRGGTTTEHSTFTGAVREVTVDTDKDTLVVHDGSTAGGFPIPRSDSDIKTAYENNSDTNAFTDAEQTKLSGIEANATADQTGSEIKALYEAEANAFTDAQFTKLAGIETGATADQTGAEIKTAYEGEADTNAFTDAEKTKLSGIEALADVTDATNVEAAGAVMDSELTSEASVKALDQGVATTDTPTFAGIITAGNVDGRDVSVDGAKLDGIEAGATADQTGAEIKTAYESEADTNAFTDSEKTKLAGIEASADVTDAANVEPLVDAHINVSGASSGQYLEWSGSDYTWSTVDLTTQVSRSGDTMSGFLTLHADPTNALHAATKEYVDTIAAAGIHYHDPVRVESPSNLNATYNNGSSGVGATLTNAGTQAALVIDGVTLNSADRVLVYNQTNAAHNGVYTVTNVGSGSTNWVLTRATDADSYGTSDPEAFGEGDAFFVKEGDTGAGELYVMNTAGTITFGTTAITFTVIAETAVYTAGTGITLDGTVFSIGQDVATSSNVTFNNITVTGTVDGRDVASDGSKLDSIESGATGDQTASEIRALVESATDSNVFTDADHTKLNGIESGATGDQTASEIKIAYESNSNTNAFTDALLTKLNGIETSAKDDQTITAGSGLSGGGTGNVTLSHADTSSVTDSNNSGNTFIQDITFDTYGHVQSIGTGTVSVGNGTLTVEGTGALGGSGTFTANQSGNTTISISHDDTSSQSSVNNSGATVIQDVTLDTYGHVTGLASKTLSYSDVGAQAAGTYNTIIGTDTDINTSGSTIIDNIYVTDGVITSMGTRVLTLADLGYTGATNANYITNNNQLTNGAGYTTFTANQSLNTNNSPTFSNLYVDGAIYSYGDTNTYTQYHAGDQWRVVVGGSERLEVKNSSPHVLVSGDLNSTSDERLKENINPIENALSDICKLNGVSFNWKDTGTKASGFIAQQVEPILPDLVNTNDDDGIKSVNYIGLIGHLVEAIKEQQEQINALKEQINS